MLHQPRVVFLDEPTSGVDPLSRRRFWRLIDAMSAEGVTVFVTTHYLEEAEHCHRLALIHAGRLAALGTVDEVKAVFRGRAVLEVAGREWPTRWRRSPASRSCARSPRSARGCTWWWTSRGEGGARVVELLEAAGNGPATAERIVPSLEDVFIHHVQGRGRAEAQRVRKLRAVAVKELRQIRARSR